jgi:hypothetical protein
MTAQIHEIVLIEGVRASLTCCPAVPQGHPRIVEVEPDRAHAENPPVLFTTACWRGYQGTWKIEGNRLYLVALRGVLKLVGDEPLFAEWVSGTLRVPQGEIVEYVHMGFESVYEGNLFFQVERGIVTGSAAAEGNYRQGSISHPDTEWYKYLPERPRWPDVHDQ